jgi:hypothetical protein
MTGRIVSVFLEDAPHRLAQLERRGAWHRIFNRPAR